IAPVDPSSVLARLRHLPVATSRYREEPDGVRHMGPMAQDFRAAFGLGDSDRSYYSVDAHGVALASIQALHAIAQEQNRRIERLERDNADMREQLRRLGSATALDK